MVLDGHRAVPCGPRRIVTSWNPLTSFVGDSLTDVKAAQAAQVPCIGYANKPHKAQVLADAGADALILSMHEPAAALTEHLRACFRWVVRPS